MPPRAFAGPLGVNQGEGIPPPRDLITSDTPPGSPRSDDGDDLSVASICNIGMRANKKAMAGAVQVMDESMTPEQGLLNLRRKIALQLKGGSHGLMRCWVLFRNRSGSTKQGITFAEFKRGLKSYAIDAPERVAREMFNRMDASGDDHIQIKEFIDHVMGRWDPSANVLGGHKSAADIRGASFDRDKVKRLLVKDAVDDTLTVERGLVMLRQKIGQRLASGPGGLLRCWVNFRQRAGASKEGITASEWERGLKMYGVPLNKARAKELFDRMDASGDGYIQIKEFIDQVMGRWTAEANMHTGGKSADEVRGKDGEGKRRASLMVKDKVDPNMTVEDGKLALRRTIGQRLKSGPNGLMRCWVEFRNRAGSSKEGISRSEFKRGLKLYGIPLHPSKTDELFDRMDASGDGYIQIKEFIDQIMGRWDASVNAGGTDGLGGKVTEGRKRALEAEQRASKKTLAIDADGALTILRAKVSQRLKPGGHGLQRAWRAFRNSGGGDHEGIPRSGLDRALHAFGLPLDKPTTDEIFRRLDVNGDGFIHEHEFVRVIMGRSKLKARPRKEPEKPPIELKKPPVVKKAPEPVEPLPEPELPPLERPRTADDTPRRRKSPLKRPGSGTSPYKPQELARPSTSSLTGRFQSKGKQPGAVLRERIQASLGKRGQFRRRNPNLAALQAYDMQ